MPRAEVLYYISEHDTGEQLAGDVPFGGKSAVPGLGDCMNKAEEMGHQKLGVVMPVLTPEEFALVKISDALEMWEFGCVEVELGNKYGEVIAVNAGAAALKRAAAVHEHETVRRWMDQQGRKHYV